MKEKIILFLLVLFGVINLEAGVTGKISGRVIDKNTGEPLPGAQVMITGKWNEGNLEMLSSPRGGVADANGYYFIINIPPGEYEVKVMMIGYRKAVIKRVEVNSNSTVTLNFEMEEEAINVDEVVVTATKASVKKAQTSSKRNIGASEISVLPTESVGGVVNMQAGVVGGHFRGGRLNEVSYMIDGIAIDEVVGGSGKLVNIETDVVQDIEVITGTFNAEYGRAMSGVVNVVTKDGSNNFMGKLTLGGGNYITGHKKTFIGLKNTDFDRNKDLRIQLEGPILKDKINFFINYRYADEDGYLNGIYRFNPDDYSDFLSRDSSEWYSEHTGNNKYVPMNTREDHSIFGKLSFKLYSGIKLSFSYIGNYYKRRYYSHTYKYNPYALPTQYVDNNMYSFLLNHTINKNLFYELKLSKVDNFSGSYKYKNPLDKRYVHDAYGRNNGCSFSTGGESKSHNRRWTKDGSIKFDITYQMNQNHNIKTGFEYIAHDINWKNYTIVNKYRGTQHELDFYDKPIYDADSNIIGTKRVYLYYEPEILDDSTNYADVYSINPKEYSWYIQDKMEFDELVINIGVRYDRFDPETVYPSNWRNPANQLSFPNNPEKMSVYKKAEPKTQLSPRFGLSYLLGRSAVLHFSYGHFLQIPPYYSIYTNHSFKVVDINYATMMGNPQIRAEKSVKYEIGLWQELMRGLSLDIVLHYSDVYNLLSSKIMTTYNQTKYGLYCNKDYGNRKGLEVKLDYSIGNLYSSLNYTLQYTRGNADNPTQTFTRAGNSMDPITRLIPMSWDQRHTVHITSGIRGKNYHATLTMNYGSGMAYTWSPISENRLSRVNLYPNNSHRPATMSIDFDSHYDIKILGRKLRISLLVYNLTDRKNEYTVNSTTGRANQVILREDTIENFHSNWTDIYDWINDPTAYSAPRYVKVSMSMYF